MPFVIINLKQPFMSRSLITIISAVLLIAVGSSAINAPERSTYTNGASVTGYSTGCGCHSAGGPTGSVILVGLPDTVVVNQKYAISLVISDPVAKRWGFDMAAGSGKITSTNSNVAITGSRNIHHGTAAPFGPAPSYTYDSIYWTAPATPPTGGGTVKFNYAANAANGDNLVGGDHTYKGSFTTHVIVVTPVKLQSFDAIVVGNNVKISWLTATELNTDHFEIERSSNGKDFATVGKVTASGNSTTTKSYSYTDDASKLNGTVYYRLKSVDKSGASNYSSVVSKEINLSAKLVTKLYPNPLREGQDIKLTYLSEKATNVTFIITNASGKKVSANNLSVTAGSNNLSLPANRLSAGVYHLSVSVDNAIVQSLPVIVE